AEMAVTGKTEVETKSSEIVILCEEVERAGETEPQLIAIERHAFHLLENLREVGRRAADVGGDFGERPAACQVAGEHELPAVHKALAAKAGGGMTRRSWTEGALYESEGETLRFERLGDTMTKTMAKKRNESLRTRVNTQPLLTEGEKLVLLQQAPRGEFGQKRFSDEQSKARVAAGNGMANAVAFCGVEKKNLVGLCDGLVGSQMADVDTPVGENHLCC